MVHGIAGMPLQCMDGYGGWCEGAGVGTLVQPLHAAFLMTAGSSGSVEAVDRLLPRTRATCETALPAWAEQHPLPVLATEQHPRCHAGSAMLPTRLAHAVDKASSCCRESQPMLPTRLADVVDKASSCCRQGQPMLPTRLAQPAGF